MSVGMPSDAEARELESRHDDLLKQLEELDERVLQVLSTCQEYRGRECRGGGPGTDEHSDVEQGQEVCPAVPIAEAA